MRLYKILVEKEGVYYSPFQEYYYGSLEDLLGKPMTTTCSQSDDSCDSGFYATPLEGLIYTNLSRPGTTVFEVEMGGDSKKFSEFKQRFSEQKFIRVVPMDEVKELVKGLQIGYDLYHALWPVNPTEIFNDVTEEDWVELDKWYSVWDSVWDSVRDSVWASVRDSVMASVTDSVWTSVGAYVRASVWTSVRASVADSVTDSVWASVRAYVGYLFQGIKTWKYVEHVPGVYPFQSAVNLWYRGLIAVRIGDKWGLYSSKLKEVIFKD